MNPKVASFLGRAVLNIVILTSMGLSIFVVLDEYSHKSINYKYLLIGVIMTAVFTKLLYENNEHLI